MAQNEQLSYLEGGTPEAVWQKSLNTFFSTSWKAMEKKVMQVELGTANFWPTFLFLFSIALPNLLLSGMSLEGLKKNTIFCWSCSYLPLYSSCLGLLITITELLKVAYNDCVDAEIILVSVRVGFWWLYDLLC